MRRSTVLIVTLFAMLWQPMTYARLGPTANGLADLEQAVRFTVK